MLMIELSVSGSDTNPTATTPIGDYVYFYFICEVFL